MGTFLYSMGLYWKIFFFLFMVIKVTSQEKYEPIRMVLCSPEDDTDKHLLTISYTQEIANGCPVLSFCPNKPTDEKEYIMENPSDSKISSIALNLINESSISRNYGRYLPSIVKTTCSYPLQIARERNVEAKKSQISPSRTPQHEILNESKVIKDNFEGTSKVNTKENESRVAAYWHYSLYGFYAQQSQILLFGSDRVANNEFFQFIQLYKSIENADMKLFFYRYAISTAIAYRFKKKYSKTRVFENEYKNYYEDTCNGVQLKDIFRDNAKTNLSAEFINEMKLVNTNEKEFTRYDRNFRIAHLVPSMHLLFDGSETLRGNCSVVAVWEETYKYLLDVDKALIQFVEKEKKNVYISAGYPIINAKLGVVLPDLIWKQVIVHKEVDEHRVIDEENSFAIIISNEMAFDKETNMWELEKLHSPCKRSCSETKLDVKDEGYGKINIENDETGITSQNDVRIINCCKLTDEAWKVFQTFNLINFHPRE